MGAYWIDLAVPAFRFGHLWTTLPGAKKIVIYCSHAPPGLGDNPINSPIGGITDCPFIFF
jgi:hypothetical protein